MRKTNRINIDPAETASMKFFFLPLSLELHFLLYSGNLR